MKIYGQLLQIILTKSLTPESTEDARLLYSNSTSFKLNLSPLQPVWYLQHPFAVAYNPSTWTCQYVKQPINVWQSSSTIVEETPFNKALEFTNQLT